MHAKKGAELTPGGLAEAVLRQAPVPVLVRPLAE
jgi:hypothetical protein